MAELSGLMYNGVLFPFGEHVELPNYLCFTANTANAKVKLSKYGSPTVLTLETSTDGNSWSTYTFWSWITLSNIWDKVYWRNTSTTDTGFSTSFSDIYQFSFSWNVSASWDINFLLNKNSTNSVSSNCYRNLFNGCSSLITAPSLPATIVDELCYAQMFYDCLLLETLPILPASTLADSCYSLMFGGCSKIKLSTTQTWEYQTPYRIPITWTGVDNVGSALSGMFTSTWWTFTWTPSINTTYYTSNTLV